MGTAGRRRQSADDPLRRRRAGDAPPHLCRRAARRAAGRRAAPQPAGLDPGQLPACANSRAICRRSRPSRTGGRCRSSSSTRRPGSPAATATAPLVVRYASMRSTPRSARPSSTPARGFFNGTGVCLRVEGRERSTACARADGPAAPAGTWRPRSARRRPAPATSSSPPDYDALVDHPVELGRFWRGRFEAAGVPHEFVVAGALPDFDGDRLLADTQRVCAAEIAFWHGSGRAPFERYLFLLNALEDGRGGLEHRSSTALVAARRDLPRRATAEAADGSAARPETERRLRRRARPDRARVLPCLEREAAEAARVRRRSTMRARTTRACSGSSKASPRTTTICSCCAAA